MDPPRPFVDLLGLPDSFRGVPRDVDKDDVDRRRNGSASREKEPQADRLVESEDCRHEAQEHAADAEEQAVARGEP